MAIFDTHHPGALVFGLLGNFVSFLVFFAPVPTFVRIYKEKSTLGFDSLPYSVALFSCMLWLYYAFLKKNEFLLISINSFGFFIETIYLAIFLYYATKKARTHAIKLLGGINVGLFALIYFITYFALPGHIRAPVVGWICVGFAVTVFAAPLSIVFRVVRTRSVEFMPFGLSFFLTLSAVMWFAYGGFRKDICIAIPNVLGFILGVLQMILYGIYRNAKPVKEDEEKAPGAAAAAEDDNNKINIRVVETPELVHPVEHNKGDEETTDRQLNCIPCEISVKPGEVNVQMDSPMVVVRAA